MKKVLGRFLTATREDRNFTQREAKLLSDSLSFVSSFNQPVRDTKIFLFVQAQISDILMEEKEELKMRH